MKIGTLGLFAAVSAACAGIACADGSDFVPSARTGVAIQQAIRNLTMTMTDDPESDFSANRDWRPPAEDGFRVPKSNALPFGLSFYCVEGLQLEGYRMVSGHPEWWIKDVKHFD